MPPRTFMGVREFPLSPEEAETPYLVRSTRYMQGMDGSDCPTDEPLLHVVDCIQGPRDTYTPQISGEIPSFVVARLGYEEYSTAAADFDNRDLWEWLDNVDGGVSSAFAHLRRRRLRGVPLAGVLYLRELHVRSSHRGHNLGLALLDLALEYHSVFGGPYLALLEAAPIWSIFEPVAEGRDDFPPQPPEAMRAMQRYYRQIGFERCYRKLPATAPHGAFMYRVVR